MLSLYNTPIQARTGRASVEHRAPFAAVSSVHAQKDTAVVSFFKLCFNGLVYWGSVTRNFNWTNKIWQDFYFRIPCCQCQVKDSKLGFLSLGTLGGLAITLAFSLECWGCGFESHICSLWIVSVCETQKAIYSTSSCTSLSGCKCIDILNLISYTMYIVYLDLSYNPSSILTNYRFFRDLARLTRPEMSTLTFTHRILTNSRWRHRGYRRNLRHMWLVYEVRSVLKGRVSAWSSIGSNPVTYMYMNITQAYAGHYARMAHFVMPQIFLWTFWNSFKGSGHYR